jgi:hypothetical protein
MCANDLAEAARVLTERSKYMTGSAVGRSGALCLNVAEIAE